jgi:hypothetical protein
MRKFVPIIAVLLGVLFGLARADAATVIRLHAASVCFYYDRFLVEADGNVHVTTSDGMTMTGDSFSMDLKLNRFLLAGHVHVQDPSGSQDGAALADFLDFSRIYFVPLIVPQAQAPDPTPDRWTFVNGDFAHPEKGRIMPGDTFFFPDTGNAQPFLKSDSATIGSRSFVRFGGNHIDIANGMGAYIPTPSYYVNFSNDQHLGDNSLAGANYDATWEFAGGANAISALHFRYDTVNKTYLSFEQHLSGSKAYAVFSVNPMTRPSKFWDLVLSDKPSDTFQVRTFTQLHTFQHGLSQPDQAGQFTILQAVKALPQSFLQLNVQDTNFSLLPPGLYHGVGPVIDHPWTMNLTAQSFDHRIGKLPLYERLAYSFGYTHDSKGLQFLQGDRYTTIWQHGGDLQLYVPSFVVGKDNGPYRNYYLNASFDKNRTWFSVPHYTDIATTRLTLSRTFNKHYNAFLGYTVQNTGDYYGALQTSVYTPFTPVVYGVPYPGYEAFRGQATFRETALDVNYNNNGDVSASILLRKHDDFPKPIPFLFQPPPLDVLGREITGQNYLGEPPYDVTADLRFRVNPHMSIDVSRSYYFNFGNRRWNPEFVIQVQQ